MTRIDFYVLGSEEEALRLGLVCRLAEKAVDSGQSVFVHGDDEALLARLDEALWSFRPSAFVPHRVLAAGHTPSVVDSDPVQLSTGEPPTDRRLLINLATAVPAFFSRFERTLEVIDERPDVRDAGRERYRFYRHRGYPLAHHRLPSPSR